VPKDLIVIPGAEHLEWIDEESPYKAEYMAKVVAWFDEHLR
jgi:hypothetical protein